MGQLYISIYDKRDDFNFHITNFPVLSSNIYLRPLIRFYLTFYSICPWMLLRFRTVLLRAAWFSNKLLVQGYVSEYWNHHWESSMFGELIKQFEVPVSLVLNAILKLGHIQWHPQPITYVLHVHQIITLVFHKAFATGLPCKQETLTPPDTCL